MSRRGQGIIIKVLTADMEERQAKVDNKGSAYYSKNYCSLEEESKEKS